MILPENITKHKLFIPGISILICVLAFILRFYRFHEFVGYHQDQVRDLLFIKSHFDSGTPILLGPKTSVGNIFLPPFWYYLMAGVYLVSHAAWAPALLVVILSSLTTLIIFFLARHFFNTTTAIVSALLYAVSPLSIEYGRFAWNPNPVPFFAVLTFLALFFYYEKRRVTFFYLALASALLVFQLHYFQGFIIALVCGVFFVLRPLKKAPDYIISLLLVILFLSPFLYYELSHGFENIQTASSFLSHTGSQGKYFGINNFIKSLFIDYPQFIAKVLFFSNKWAGRIMFVVLNLYILFKWYRSFQKKKFSNTVLLSLIYVVPYLALLIYRQWIIDYYVLVMIVPVIILFVIFLYDVLPKQIAHASVFILVLLNLMYSPAFRTPQFMLPFFEKVNTTIIGHNASPTCIRYSIATQELTFAQVGVNYLYTTSPHPNNTQCLHHYILCENSLCPKHVSEQNKVAQNDSLNLRFIEL